MLKTRVITAAILLVGFCADLFFASIDVFALVLAFVVAAAAWEWSRLSGVVDEHAQTAYACIVGLLVMVGLYLPYGVFWTQWLLLGGFLFWIVVPAVFYMSAQHEPIKTPDTMLLAVGFWIFLVTAISIQYLRSMAPDSSVWLLLYAFTIIWVMDIGAYFSGKRLGKNKLAPQISPGKTWEGVAGGLLATTVLMIIVLIFADWADGNGVKVLVATIFAAAASVLGDLYESRIKRATGIKDSSQLLPGHGGVLDRLDGVLAAMPVFAFVWAWL